MLWHPIPPYRLGLDNLALSVPAVSMLVHTLYLRRAGRLSHQLAGRLKHHDDASRNPLAPLQKAVNTQLQVLRRMLQDLHCGRAEIAGQLLLRQRSAGRG